MSLLNPRPRFGVAFFIAARLLECVGSPSRISKRLQMKRFAFWPKKYGGVSIRESFVRHTCESGIQEASERVPAGTKIKEKTYGKRNYQYAVLGQQRSESFG